jgi:Flp pilus assembly CpaE family ATPase
MIVALISPDEAIRHRVQSALAPDELFEALWSVPDYPDAEAMSALIDHVDGCIVVVDFGSSEPARDVASQLSEHSHLRLVAVNAELEGGGFSSAAQSGIRDIFGASFSNAELAVAMRRAAQQLQNDRRSPGGELNVFLPARPGAGATTVAIHTASALAGLTRTAYLDFDLKLGISSFLLKLHSDHSVKDALENVRRLDDALWEQMVSRRDHLDVLGSAPDTFQSQPPDSAFELLLRFARRRYNSVCVDLPGSMDSHEVVALRHASRILLVCVPDIAGMHMARRKLAQLDELGLGDKVWVVLNQSGGRHLFCQADAEKVLGRSARFVIPEDRNAISDAVQQAAFVRSSSTLGRRLAGLAADLAVESSAPAPVPPARRFLEFFSVTETRRRLAS